MRRSRSRPSRRASTSERDRWQRRGGASVGAEGAAAACGVKRTRLAIAPARLDQRPNAKPDRRRLRGPRQRMRSFGVTARRLQPQVPLSRPTIRDGRPRRPTSSFCAVWLSSTSGSHAVAAPNGRRTRPQQSRARRWRRHRRRQFSHPRIAGENSTVAGISSGCRPQQEPGSAPSGLLLCLRKRASRRRQPGVLLPLLNLDGRRPVPGRRCSATKQL